jgi:murein DD-endopeptidase MepM/ murein hydrolase activator NlpD
VNAKPLALLVAIGAALFVLCGGTVVLPIFMIGQAAAQSCGAGALGVQIPADPALTAKYTDKQLSHAAVIVGTGSRLGIPPRGFVIALATALQESSLRNMANNNPRYPLVALRSLLIPHEGVGHDHDSVGLFQQRPSPPEGAGSWGSVRELMTPAISAEKFYAALKKVNGWEQMRLTDAAQAVQRSGFPEAYQKWEPDASVLAAKLLGVPNIADVGGGAPIAPCGTDVFGPVPVGPGGWVQPVRAGIVSPFGPRGLAFHAGVDLGAPRGTPIRAAAAGVVETMRCQASIGTCDRDGGVFVLGCGWYVDIRHAGNIVTRYCHMGSRPQVNVGDAVTAGQVLGFVGSSGHSSGPHLHFEVHRNVPSGPFHAGRDNAVDPVPFMRQVGAPLGG